MQTSPLFAALLATVSATVLAGPSFAQAVVEPVAPPPLVVPVAPAPGDLVPAYRSDMTARFIAAAMPNVDFLDSSSRLALDRSPNARLRSLARREATDQTISANTMTAWADANAPIVTGRSAYVAPATPADAVVGLATVPFDVAADVTEGVGSTLTGASPAQSALPSTSASQRDDLARLSNRSGRDFDRLYVSTQLDALSQLSTLYSDYMRNGDDAGLRALAARELPVINHRIAELQAL